MMFKMKGIEDYTKHTIFSILTVTKPIQNMQIIFTKIIFYFVNHILQYEPFFEESYENPLGQM